MRWWLPLFLVVGCDFIKSDAEDASSDWSTDSGDLVSPPGLFDADGGPDGGTDGGEGVLSILVEPATVTLTTDGLDAGSATFTAFAVDADGGTTEVSVDSWLVQNPAMGTIDAQGNFQSTTTRGGSTSIVATVDGNSGSALATILFDRQIVVGGIGDALIDSFRTADAIPADTPALQYPLQGTVVPKNLEGFAFAWDTPEETSISELRLQTPTSNIRVFTDETSWASDASLISALAGFDDSTPVTVGLRSATINDGAVGTVYEGASAEWTVTGAVDGSILYWRADTTGSMPGGDIMRLPLNAGVADTLWSSVEDSGGVCVGCHTPVEATDRMVVTHQGVNGNFSIIDISDPDYPETLLGTAEERRATYHAASPDGELLLTVADGRAKLYSLTTGAYLMELDTEGYKVSHPDWSPTNDSILLVRVTSTSMNDMNFEGGEIIKMSWDGSAFGAAEVLAAATADANRYAPRFSPDGEWIVYNQAVRTEIVRPWGSVEFSSTSYANPSAELWLMDNTGGNQVRLDHANQPGELQRSIPSWAPDTEDGRMWLTYSSRQTYPADASAEGLPQIWVSAIDTTVMTEGIDPSAPAFWLPGQDPTEDNHLPVWWSR